MALLFQLYTEFRSIENLAVEDDPDLSARVAHWLMTTVKVKNAQPAHGQRYRLIRAPVNPLIIGATMDDGAVHSADPFALLTTG